MPYNVQCSVRHITSCIKTREIVYSFDLCTCNMQRNEVFVYALRCVEMGPVPCISVIFVP